MSTLVPLTAVGILSWERVLPRVKRAVVFLDSACAESLHWSCGGAVALLRAGALDVRSLRGPVGSPEQPKAVFVLSGPMRGRALGAVQDVVQGSHFQYCQVFLGEAMEEASRGHLEEQLCQWMGDMNFTAEVSHAPLAWAALSQHLLLLPGFASLFPPLPADMQRLAGRPRTDKKKPVTSATELDLPAPVQAHVRSLARTLSSLLEVMGMREECFALGAFSRLLATELAGDPQAKSRRKTAPHRCSLLFIDRSVDLTGAVGHHGDSLVEKIISVLPRLPGHSNDVAINMAELTALRIDDNSNSIIASGCLAQPTFLMDNGKQRNHSEEYFPKSYIFNMQFLKMNTPDAIKLFIYLNMAFLFYWKLHLLSNFLLISLPSLSACGSILYTLVLVIQASL